MKEVIIKLDSVSKVKNFVNKLSTHDGEMVICSIEGPYIIDAKSIMGIFSLDLSQNLRFRCKDETAEIPEDIMEVINPYILK